MCKASFYVYNSKNVLIHVRVVRLCSHQTDPRFPLDNLDLPGREDIFRICMI